MVIKKTHHADIQYSFGPKVPITIYNAVQQTFPNGDDTCQQTLSFTDITVSAERENVL